MLRRIRAAIPFSMTRKATPRLAYRLRCLSRNKGSMRTISTSSLCWWGFYCHCGPLALAKPLRSAFSRIGRLPALMARRKTKNTIPMAAANSHHVRCLVQKPASPGITCGMFFARCRSLDAAAARSFAERAHGSRNGPRLACSWAQIAIPRQSSLIRICRAFPDKDRHAP